MKLFRVIVATLLIFLSAAWIAIWLRSEKSTDVIYWGNSSVGVHAETYEGKFLVDFLTPYKEFRLLPSSVPEYSYDHTTAERFDRLPGSHLRFERFGFILVTGERWQERHHCMVIPFWALTLFAMIYPLTISISFFTKRRATAVGYSDTHGFDIQVR